MTFPHDLLEFPWNEPENSHREWWVLYVRSRQEKSLARQLRESRVPFFLPLTRNPFRVRGRVMESHVPLFPGYVFLLGDREDRGKAIATGRVIRCLPVPDQQELWDDLCQLHRLVTSGLSLTAETRLAPGMTVEIRDGALAGLRGKILRGATGRRFVVQVNFIQQGASILMDGANLMQVEVEAEAVGCERVAA
jgi:transcriptional antiterminator RfaH